MLKPRADASKRREIHLEVRCWWGLRDTGQGAKERAEPNRAQRRRRRRGRDG